MCGPFAVHFAGDENAIAPRRGWVSDNSCQRHGRYRSLLNARESERSNHSRLEITLGIGHGHFDCENAIFLVSARGNTCHFAFVLFRVVLQVNVEFLAQAELLNGVLWNTETNFYRAGVSDSERDHSGRRQISEFDIASQDETGKGRAQIRVGQSQLRLSQAGLRLVHSTST